MKTTSVVLGIILVGSCVALAADSSIQPMNVKLGLWEVTTVTETTGMPPIPPDALANMTPEQREKVEAMMKARGMGAPRTTTRKSCMTKEKMDKGAMFGEDRPNCTRTVVTSTSSKVEVHMQCKEHDTTSNVTLKVEALSSENVKGSMQADASGSGHTMNINSNFTGKWVGAACGDVE